MMEWINWILVIFLATMLALLVYSIVSTSSAIRKKVQPSLDTFLDGLFNAVFRRLPSAERDHARGEKRPL